MSKISFLNWLIFLLLLTFNIFTALTTNKLVIHNRMLLYTIFYIILGAIYPFLYKYMIEKDILLVKGILKILLFVAVTQIISYCVYLVKTEAYRYGDWMGLIIFLSYFGYSIILAIVFYFVGFMVNKQLFK